MSSPDGEKHFILYDLMKTDFSFLLKPLIIEKKRKVKFNNTMEVYDIISRYEIIENNLKHILWWDTADYESFMLDAYTEINQFITRYPSVDFLTARKIIYNPNYVNSLLETIIE